MTDLLAYGIIAAILAAPFIALRMSPAKPQSRRKQRREQDHVRYRFYGGDQLLYIGRTNNLARRLAEHAHTKWWFPHVTNVKVEHYRSQKDLERAEREAIRAEHPMFNDVYNRR